MIPCQWKFVAEGKTPDQNGIKIIAENYSDEIIILSLVKDIPAVCFSDNVDKLQIITD